MTLPRRVETGTVAASAARGRLVSDSAKMAGHAALARAGAASMSLLSGSTPILTGSGGGYA